MEVKKRLHGRTEILGVGHLFGGTAVTPGGEFALIARVLELGGAFGLERGDAVRRSPNTARKAFIIPFIF